MLQIQSGYTDMALWVSIVDFNISSINASCEEVIWKLCPYHRNTLYLQSSSSSSHQHRSQSTSTKLLLPQHVVFAISIGQEGL
jgi:hypothetical protein